jgi:dTMP kinase
MATGKFISIEGGEGVGKSTQIAALAFHLRELGIQVVVTREPGGTDAAETIRELLLNGDEKRWGIRSEALLFAAARSDHVENLIRPALEEGKWVITDRFLDSSRAYQGGGSGLADCDILELHRIGSQGFLPHRTLVLRLPETEATKRADARDGDNKDRIGARNHNFHQQVHASFHKFADADPARIRLVDASGDKFAVTQRLLGEIEDLLP